MKIAEVIYCLELLKKEQESEDVEIEEVCIEEECGNDGGDCSVRVSGRFPNGKLYAKKVRRTPRLAVGE